MKTFITTLTVLIAAMFLTTPAMADDVEDIKAQVLSLFAALRVQDANAYYGHHLEELTSFGPGGGLLGTAPLDQRRRGIRAAWDAGSRANVQPRHIEVQVYGNAAVVTAYVTGTRTTANGNSRPIAERSTQVWIKQGGQWKEAHFHASPLRLPQ